MSRLMSKVSMSFIELDSYQCQIKDTVKYKKSQHYGEASQSEKTCTATSHIQSLHMSSWNFTHRKCRLVQRRINFYFLLNCPTPFLEPIRALWRPASPNWASRGGRNRTRRIRDMNSSHQVKKTALCSYTNLDLEQLKALHLHNLTDIHIKCM